MPQFIIIFVHLVWLPFDGGAEDTSETWETFRDNCIYRFRNVGYVFCTLIHIECEGYAKSSLIQILCDLILFNFILSMCLCVLYFISMQSFSMLMPRTTTLIDDWTANWNIAFIDFIDFIVLLFYCVIELLMIRDRIRTTNNMLGDCYAAAVVEQLSRKELMALDAASILVYQVCCACAPLAAVQVINSINSINSRRFKWKIGKFFLLVLLLVNVMFYYVYIMCCLMLLFLETGFAHQHAQRPR